MPAEPQSAPPSHPPRRSIADLLRDELHALGSGLADVLSREQALERVPAGILLQTAVAVRDATRQLTRLRVQLDQARTEDRHDRAA
jgi:predicted RNA-binding Zn ribbon-like protein